MTVCKIPNNLYNISATVVTNSQEIVLPFLKILKDLEN